MDGAAPLHKIGVILAPCWVGPPKKFLHREVFLVKWQLRMGAEFRFCKVGPKLCHTTGGSLKLCRNYISVMLLSLSCD